MKKDIIKALKIALSCCLSIFVAEYFDLQYSATAGIVALLTVTDTRQQTLTLAIQRLLSFLVSIIIAIFVFQTTQIHWLTFGIYIFFIVAISYHFNWHGTISVNAVIGTHILFSPAVTSKFIMNEFWIVFIGSLFAISMNMIIPKKTYQEIIHEDMIYSEKLFISIFQQINQYLLGDSHMEFNQSIIQLEKHLEKAMKTAIENNENINKTESQKYIDYYDTRLEQIGLLKNIVYKFKQIHHLSEIDIINVTYLINEIIEDFRHHHYPHHHKKQCMRIKESFFHSLDNIEDKAILYGIVLDIEEFIERQIELQNAS